MAQGLERFAHFCFVFIVCCNVLFAFAVFDCWKTNINDIKMNENKTQGERGICWTCPYYETYANYCDYYKMYLNDNGREPTCNNPELEKTD